MKFKVYLDEDMPGGLARALHNRGLDVLTTGQAGNLGKPDEKQLEFAVESKRVLVTANKKDFILLHREYAALNRKHFGIVLVTQDQIGLLLSSLLRLNLAVAKEEMINRLEFLSNWK